METANKINLIPVRKLLTMKFFIPDYQRGYRWTDQQVKDMMEDILDFSRKKKKEYEFYCMQPLVVRQMTDTAKQLYNLSVSNTWYEVIDGQQRLTTLFLILSALKKESVGAFPSVFYTIRYQREINSGLSGGGFLDTIDTIQELDLSTIEHYYISRAFLFIQKLISEWKEAGRFCAIDFCKTLLETLPVKAFHSCDKANNVRFIWYETVEPDPVKVFTRLNIGKIALTNSELIKAMLLSEFRTDTDSRTTLRQRELAEEWERIEYTLQDDEFWLFLNNDTIDSHPTRIDFIFDLICKTNFLKLDNENIEKAGTDQYSTFRYFYTCFHKDPQALSSCWKRIKAYFQIFLEWFEDVEYYHYIGFLIACKRVEVEKLAEEWCKVSDKPTFLTSLKTEIKQVIEKCSVPDDQYKTDGSDKRKCKPLLLFHNIQTVINRNRCQSNNDKYKLATFYKFPFHLYKLEQWDVEHINSNITNEEIDSATLKEWLMNVYLSVDEKHQNAIREAIDSSPENTDQLEKCYHDLKKLLPQSDSWSEEEKNMLWNYTLLDSSTNRSYGNAIFSGKRRVIISKDKGEIMDVPRFTRDNKFTMSKKPDRYSSFVPPCTRQVFLKYYSASAGDNNYWTKADAECYLEDIKQCIKLLNPEVNSDSEVNPNSENNEQ